MPDDLNALRPIEGFPIGEDADIFGTGGSSRGQQRNQEYREARRKKLLEHCRAGLAGNRLRTECCAPVVNSKFTCDVPCRRLVPWNQSG